MPLGKDFKWMRDEQGKWLCIRSENMDGLFDRLKPDKEYDVKIEERRKKRSLDANAYCWVLLGKLAAKVKASPEDCYRQYIHDIGNNYCIVPVRADRREHWERIWCSGHVGRMVEDMGPCRNIDGYHNMRSFIGSSDYDTQQMSRLIELVVADCKEQGIETMTPEELARLVDRWDRSYGGK